MPNIEDSQLSQLICLAAKGDKHAFGRLYEHYLEEIYRFLFYKVGNKMIAEDLTEDTFLRTWEHLPSIYAKDQNFSNLRAWLYRIANNLAIDYYRKIKPQLGIDNNIRSNNKSMEKIIEDQTESQKLVKTIQKLEPRLQKIIILRFINQLSHQEIASVMKISPTHSRVLQYRALKKMKNYLQLKDRKDA